MTTHSFDLERFGNNAALKEFLRRHSLDGLELMENGEDEKQILQKEDVVGFHLLHYPCWYCFWKKDTRTLLEQVKYPRKGIMLDIGHLLHTNTALRTEEDAVKYLREVLGRYEDLSIILGVPLPPDAGRGLCRGDKEAPGSAERKLQRSLNSWQRAISSKKNGWILKKFILSKLYIQ